MLRSIVIYVFAWLIMTVYGGEICPFLESLSIVEWGVTLLIAISLAYVGRTLAASRWGVAKRPSNIEDYSGFKQFVIELAPFLVAGLGVAVFDRLYYGFPFAESGLAAVLSGMTLVGLFAAMDLTLEAERRVITSLTDEGRSLKRSRRFFPLTKKFVVLASVLMLAMMTVVLMVLSHDLTSSLTFNADFDSQRARNIMLLELAFVMAVFLIIVLDLLLTYSRNLRLLFENEISVLEAVDNGNLGDQVHVSVATNDEFGTIAHYTNRMIESLKKRTDELQRTQDVTIHSLASLAETRDNETGTHIVRTQRYVCVIATALQESWGLTEQEIDLLYKSAPLHDIGKVGVPDAILLKPGPLTDEEWVEMRRHTQYGAQALEKAEARLGSSSFLQLAKEIVETHHEKWDGTGYPGGISGSDIPWAGRIMAIADVYDALISKRAYKEAFSHKKAKEIIMASRGTHFDPEVVDAFAAQEKNFAEIAALITEETSGQETREAHPASSR